MKAKTMIAVTTLLMSAGLALAAEEAQDHKAHHPEAAGATAQQMPAGPGGGMPMMPMHEHMQKMHAQMEEIRRTEDTDKRDELIDAHMTEVQNMMKMMQDMHGGKPMLGPGGMMGQGMGMPGGKMMGGQQGKQMAPPQGGMPGQGMGMSGGKMMGGQQGNQMAPPQGGMPGGQQAGMMEMMNNQQMMQQRMDMMQMMMDQMMQNQAATEETRKLRERRHDHRKTK